MIRDVLSEIVKQTPSQIRIIKITGTDTETKIQGVDDDQLLFLEATLTNPVDEFKGEFGIANIDLLKGLLALPSHKTDSATISVKRKPWKDISTVEQFEFRHGGVGCDFRCMSPERVPKQAATAAIKWDVEFEPIGAKLTEFSQLASLFGGGELKERLFGLKGDKANIVVEFGDTHAATHRGRMILHNANGHRVNFDPLLSHADFTGIMRLASGKNTKVKICNRGVLGIDVDTALGTFRYYLRGQSR